METVLILVCVMVLAWIVARLLFPKRGPTLVCTNCGHHGPARSVTKGSTAIELVLWLCLIVPGLVYSLWRLSSRTVGCVACGSTALVPPGSPVGKHLITVAAEQYSRRSDQRE